MLKDGHQLLNGGEGFTIKDKKKSNWTWKKRRGPGRKSQTKKVLVTKSPRGSRAKRKKELSKKGKKDEKESGPPRFSRLGERKKGKKNNPLVLTHARKKKSD